MGEPLRRVWVLWPSAPAAELGALLERAGHTLAGCSDMLDDLLLKVSEIEAETLILNRFAPGTRPLEQALWQLRTRRPDLRVVLLLGDEDATARGLLATAMACGIYDWVFGEQVGENLVEVLGHPRAFADVAQHAKGVPVGEGELRWENPPEPGAEPAHPPAGARGDAGGKGREVAGTVFRALSRTRQGLWRRDAKGASDDAERTAEAGHRVALGPPGVLTFAVGRIVTVVGLHGGVGASSLCALLAHHLDRLGLRAGVLEAARGGGQLLRFFGESLVQEGVEGGRPPGELVCSCPRDMQVLPMGYGPGAMATPPKVQPYALHLRASCDVVLIDGGADLMYPPTRDAVWLSDMVVAALEPTPLGVSAAARFLQLAESGCWREKVRGLVINRRAGRQLARVDIAEALDIGVLADLNDQPRAFWPLMEAGRPRPDLLDQVEPIADVLLAYRRAPATRQQRR